VELSADAVAEIDRLAYRYGPPRRVRATIDDSFDDPIRKDDRFGEVCMVIRRPNGNVLLAIKSFYPRGAYRLPTGGIHHGEQIGDALVREAHEETGLDLEVRRFLAHIAYVGRDPRTPLFHTFAFALDERGGMLGALDESEQIEAWRDVTPAELVKVADFLDDLRSDGTRGVGGSWRAWGKFRAVVHRVVHEALVAP
jgi:ADP-ribose pyrophosphatase YjhB (NUDIX family)